MDTCKKNTRFEKDELWQIFVAAAFPLHVWAIILFLNDISWIAERTNVWDAIGVAGYGIVFSGLESILVWLIMVVIGLVFLRKWAKNKRGALLCSLSLAIMGGAILGQLLFFIPPPSSIMWGGVLISNQNPRLLINGVIGLVIGSGTLFLAYCAVYSEKFQSVLFKILDRLSPLMGLYLFLDLLGLIIVIIRNIT
ncbi:MAG: hypothetical protein WBB69_12605 [Anaerolineales bacterium]